MLKKLECAALYTAKIEESVQFYTELGLKEHWRINRPLVNDQMWTIVGLKFPEEQSSELVLQNNPELKEVDIEICVDDVRETHRNLSEHQDIRWIREPFATESGHVAVMEAPDGNVFVLVGQ